jgi:hypothetical protein
MLALLAAALASAAQPSPWWVRARAAAAQTLATAQSRAAELEDRLRAQAPHQPAGIRLLDADAARAGRLEWTAAPAGLPARVVLLVHGLDEPGDIWDDLAPALAAAGHTVARFDYPDDQHIPVSADLLSQSLAGLRAAGVADADLVCHSMGGLVARDALTRAALAQSPRPRVPRLILLGTPSAGSPLARFEALAEAREQIARTARTRDWHDLLGFFTDGRGEAADDLLPGSPFLADLNQRPWPEGTTITAVVGQLLEPAAAAHRLESTLATHLGAEPAHDAAEHLRAWAATLGDGVVPAESAAPAGVTDVVRVSATHRGMVRLWSFARGARDPIGHEPATPPAIPIVLARLAEPPPAAPHPAAPPPAPDTHP